MDAIDIAIDGTQYQFLRTRYRGRTLRRRLQRQRTETCAAVKRRTTEAATSKLRPIASQAFLQASSGLMSITGVPSIASIGPTRRRFPTIFRTVTGCNPMGFGLSGDLVAKTPVRALFGSDRGCTFNTSRCDWWNQVITINSSPG